MSAARSRVRIEAHAKVNLFLRVLRSREDGYHEIESLIAPISLSDLVTLQRAEGLTLSIGGTSGPLTEAPGGPDNLAVVAALALAEETGSLGGAAITLLKRIPVAAGLGGGSADAAAVLVGLNDLWNCGLGPDALADLAARVGSDVPALLDPSAALVSGRGEILEPIEIPAYSWVILPAAFRVRTPEAYRWWDEDGGTTGPDAASVVEAAAKGDPVVLAREIYNDLEPSVISRHPEVGLAKQRLLDAGALAVVMCGSGPTVAGLAKDPDQAGELAGNFEGAFAVSTLGR